MIVYLCTALGTHVYFSYNWCLSINFSDPMQPQSLTGVAIDSQQVLLHWKPHLDDVIFQHISSYDVTIRESGITETTNNTFLLIDSLRPYTLYTFEVKVCDIYSNCGDENSVEINMPQDGETIIIRYAAIVCYYIMV